MKILVTDGNNRAALAITRSLGIKGHIIFVGCDKHPSLASSSKFCSEKIELPDPIHAPEAFISRLLEVVADNSIDIILPVSDITTILVCENRTSFEKYCSVPFSRLEAINYAADKGKLFDLAKQLGVATPQSVYLEKYLDISLLPELPKFPIVVKPYKSRVRIGSGWLSTSVKYANNENELKTILSQEHPLAYPLLLQERIEGPGIGVFVCYNKGEPLAVFSHRRIREKPPAGGVSVLRESIPVPSLAGDFSERLLKHLQWHGVAMVEFKHDNRDNIPKLMEINGRFWGSLQLAIDAGVDFPGLLVETVQNQPVTPITSYKIGVKTRWLLGDIDALLMVLFKDRIKLKLPNNFPGRLRYSVDFFRLWEKNTYYEVLKHNDIKPWLYEVGQWLSKNTVKNQP